MSNLFHPQVLVLYLLIDVLFIYLISTAGSNRATLIPIFMLFLLFNMFGLYLLHLDIIASNPSLSKDTIKFTDTSNENIQNLTSLSLIVFNLILLIIYGIDIASNMKNSRGPAAAAAAASTSNGGGRRR